MTEYYARIDYEYDGGDAYFTVPFDYIKKDYIYVYINEEETENFTWNTSTQIIVNDDITTGDIVTIKRITPIDDKLVTYTNTSILDKDTLNLAQDQTFNAVQEIYDNNTQFQLDITETVNTQIAENKAELEAEVEEFESEVNSNLTQVYNAVEQLNRLDEILEECETLAETTTEQATNAVSSATEQATEAASSAASASETLEEITTLAQELEENIENLADTSLSNLVQKGEDKLNYNVFCVNTGDTTDEGEPAWLDVAQNIVIESDFDSEGISDLTLNNSVYFDNVTDYGDYIFAYDDGAWYLEATEVDLSDYGISFTELFSIASSISSDTITDVSVNDDTFLSTVNNTAGTYYFYADVDTAADVTVDYTSDTITDVTADESFYTDYTEETKITLTYDGSDWLLDDTAVDLSDYGITIEGEATDGDTITVTIILNTAVTWLLSGDEVLLDDYGITYEGEASNGDIIIITVTSLLVSGDIIAVTVYSPSDDTVEQAYYLTTSGEFDVTTAAGKTYTITDTLTLDITDYEDGTYNVYVNPVDLSLSVLDNTITYGITFPDDAEDGDYLLNTAKVPYDLQEINITTDEDIEETATTITTGLYDVYAGTLVIE